MMPNAQHVCFFSKMNPIFHRHGSLPPHDRRMDITYIGKGELYGVTGKIENTVVITRYWPAAKEELAAMLRNCRLFYTADACSNINNEALACGAIPVFMHNGPWTEAEIDAFEPGPMPRLRLGESLTAAGFAQFELARERYLTGLEALEQRWDASVQEFVEKVDLHFARPTMQAEADTRVDLPAVARAEDGARSQNIRDSAHRKLSRKERKRWRADIKRAERAGSPVP
jgi:hypothetical protein